MVRALDLKSVGPGSLYHCLFVLVLKSPNEEWSIKYTFIHLLNAVVPKISS